MTIRNVETVITADSLKTLEYSWSLFYCNNFYVFFCFSYNINLITVGEESEYKANISK